MLSEVDKDERFLVLFCFTCIRFSEWNCFECMQSGTEAALKRRKRATRGRLRRATSHNYTARTKNPPITKV